MLENQVECVEGMVVFDGVVRGEPWREVDATLRTIAKRRAGLDAEEAKWLVEARRAEVHRHLGFATMQEYLERVLGYGPHAASERMRVAEELEQLPEMRAALGEGRVNYSATRELTRVVTPNTEAAWLAATCGRTLREIEPMVAGRARGDFPGDPPAPGSLLHPVRFEVSGATLALLRDARIALEDDAGVKLDGDALVAALCRAVLDGPRDGDQGRARYQVAVTTCDSCTRAWQDGAGLAVEIESADREIAECDAQRLGRLDADKPARATQDIAPSVRRLVWRRDHGRCVVPGCRSSRYLDVHHLDWRAHGGGHSPDNLAVMCRAHHRAVHDGRLLLRGPAGTSLVVLHVDGRPYGAEPPSPQVIDAVGALRRLGYRRTEARTAVATAQSHVGPDAPVADLIDAALKAAGRPT